MLFPAGRAAVEVCAQPGNGGVRVGPGHLELDVAVELLEAGVATELGGRRPQELRQRLGST